MEKKSIKLNFAFYNVSTSAVFSITDDYCVLSVCLRGKKYVS